MCADWEVATAHQLEFLTLMESTVWANGSEMLPLEQVSQTATCQRTGL